MPFRLRAVKPLCGDWDVSKKQLVPMHPACVRGPLPPATKDTKQNQPARANEHTGSCAQTKEQSSARQTILIGRHSARLWMGSVWNAIFHGLRNICQRSQFAGKSLKSRGKRGLHQIWGSEFWSFGARQMEFSLPTTIPHPTRLPPAWVLGPGSWVYPLVFKSSVVCRPSLWPK